MQLLAKLSARLFARPAPIDSSRALADFIDSRAAFLCQKGTVEFCRVRAGVYWQKLFSEEEFQAALELSRWHAYPACYALVAQMVEGALREPAGIRRLKLADALTELSRATFASYPQPAGTDPHFWDAALLLVRDHLSALQGEPVQPVRQISDPLARVVFEALPIHPQLLANDYDYIYNFLRMNVLRAHEDFIARVDAGAVVDDLVGPAS